MADRRLAARKRHSFGPPGAQLPSSASELSLSQHTGTCIYCLTKAQAQNPAHIHQPELQVCPSTAGGLHNSRWALAGFAPQAIPAKRLSVTELRNSV
ncbi:hypothetical protein SKAU_G00035880 [Synaphobranchus kaupii]|uniref:Uncharacterized protein n=1 Tax=Synaphobranchus kaupii TaxID=118154 RepID=A0A9Q1GG52_SYNKA|nr:hypothetical protein SKAU_G00035880 [Synaphobranchus kaupii]